MSTEEIVERLGAVRAIIDAEATRGPVSVLCVTKRFGPSVVRDALRAGITDCGENYVDELISKAKAMNDAGVNHPRWHFIGALQRNKIARIAPACAGIHSVSRQVELAALSRNGYLGDVYFQVAPPGSKAGRNGAEVGDVARLVLAARSLGLNVAGLMGMALPGPEAETRAYFRSVRALADDLGLVGCSMGMSGDFVVALQEGSSLIRLGTYLLGERA